MTVWETLRNDRYRGTFNLERISVEFQATDDLTTVEDFLKNSSFNNITVIRTFHIVGQREILISQ